MGWSIRFQFGLKKIIRTVGEAAERWTPDQDEKLLKAVSSFGASKDWRKVSCEVGRLENDCKQRWEDLLEDAPWDREEEDKLLFYYASLGNYQWTTLVEMCSTPEKYRTTAHVRAKLNALLDNNLSPSAAGKLLERRTSSQGKPEKEKKIQEAGKPDKEEKRKEGKPEVEEVIRKKGLVRKLDHKTEGAAKKASAERNAGKPESSGKKKVKKVKIEEPSKEVADEDQSAFVVGADSEGLPEKGEGLTFLINSYSDGLAVLQEDYEEYSD